MAVSNKPEDGWEHDGFAKLASYIPDTEGMVDELMKKFQENQEQQQENSSQDQASGGPSNAP